MPWGLCMLGASIRTIALCADTGGSKKGRIADLLDHLDGFLRFLWVTLSYVEMSSRLFGAPLRRVDDSLGLVKMNGNGLKGLSLRAFDSQLLVK